MANMAYEAMLLCCWIAIPACHKTLLSLSRLTLTLPKYWAQDDCWKVPFSLLFYSLLPISFITTLQSHRALDGLSFPLRRFCYLSL